MTLFFVLSGYLITRLLIHESDSTGSIDLGRFYWNRMLRLFPAMLLMTVTVALAVAGTDWVWTVTYTANYAGIAGQDITHLVHTWSLAVEEHFYLLWPLAVLLIPVRRRVTWLIGLLALATVWRLGLLVTGAKYTWIYSATDASAFALLAGCVLAVIRWRPRPMVTLAGVVGIITVAWYFPMGSPGYLWAGFLAAGFSAVAVAGCAVHRIPVLETKWLTGLGVISYGIYLWHLPMLNLAVPMPVALLLTLAVSTLSWRAVEKPLRRLRLQPRPRSQVSAAADLAS